MSDWTKERDRLAKSYSKQFRDSRPFAKLAEHARQDYVVGWDARAPEIAELEAQVAEYRGALEKRFEVQCEACGMTTADCEIAEILALAGKGETNE